jgi:hypothetical protein
MRKQFQLARDLIIGSKMPTEEKDSLNIFLGKSFWIWDPLKHDNEYTETNGNCCFNHKIGIPIKNGIAHPLYDYEK